MGKFIITSVFLISALLSGCSLFHPYQPNIQQGNILTEQMLSQVSVGMSKEQVVGALGNPILANVFNDNHWAYVYTFQYRGGPITKKHMDIYFQNNRVVRIDRDYPNVL